MKYLIFIFLIGSIVAKSISMEDFINSKVKIFSNLDRDKDIEAVITKPYKKSKYNNFYRLLVIDDNNKILYQSPKVKDIDDSFSLGEYDCGISMPEVVVDIDKNRRSDILIPLPQCDISPTYYKSFELNQYNSSAKVKYLNSLVLVGKEYFKWREPKNIGNITWVMEFKRALTKDIVVAKIFSVKNNNYYSGLATLKLIKGGAKLLNYMLPMHNIKKEAYIAKIGPKDHNNSKGEPLKDMRDILIQDRANFHNGIRDEGDEDSNLFKSKKSREKIKRSWIIPVNTTLSNLKYQIINSNPKIEVVVKRNKLYIYLLEEFLEEDL